jgi:hypothetical protein
MYRPSFELGVGSKKSLGTLAWGLASYFWSFFLIKKGIFACYYFFAPAEVS